jgi:heat shock protein HtpX
LLSTVIRFALSRSREFLADAGSVELTKNPDAMISALRKIEGRGEIPGATSAIMEMCIDNPRNEFADLFATHPSVDRRIEALVKFAGGHDPRRITLPAAPSPDDKARAQMESEESSKSQSDSGAKPFPPQEAPAETGDSPTRNGPWGTAGRG